MNIKFKSLKELREGKTKKEMVLGYIPYELIFHASTPNIGLYSDDMLYIYQEIPLDNLLIAVDITSSGGEIYIDITPGTDRHHYVDIRSFYFPEEFKNINVLDQYLNNLDINPNKHSRLINSHRRLKFRDSDAKLKGLREVMPSYYEDFDKVIKDELPDSYTPKSSKKISRRSGVATGYSSLRTYTIGVPSVFETNSDMPQYADDMPKSMIEIMERELLQKSKQRDEQPTVDDF